jgi:alkylated DNA repair protein (DNA oxidative demethylase)
MIHAQGILSFDLQSEILELTRNIALRSPTFIPTTPNGNKLNCEMTSCGKYGWVSDRFGYRYTESHPQTKEKWTEMPELITSLAKTFASMVDEYNYVPETCLINYYKKSGKLGLHQDNSEFNLKPAIISVSLGDDAIFLVGGNKRNDPTQEVLLKSGDVFILYGESRLYFHGIKKIIPGTSSLLKNGGRLNLTIRQVK